MFRRPPRSTRTDTLLPDTTLFRSRTDATMKRMAELAMEVDGITHEIAFPGLNPLQFSNTPNNGVVFFTLAPFSERSRSAEEISAELNAKLRSEEHTSELQSLMRISYAVFCLQKKKKQQNNTN